MFKKSKKLISAWLAVIMLFTVMPFTVNATENDLSAGVGFSGADFSIVTDKLKEEPIDISLVSQDRRQTDIIPKGQFYTSAIFSNSGTLNSSNTIDFYDFTITGTRTVALQLTSSNSSVFAVLLRCNSSGNLLETTGPGVTAGQLTAFTNFNSDGNNFYTLAVVGNGTNASYTVSMNASNPGGLTQITANSNLSIVTGSLSGDFYENGNIVSANEITITGFSGGDGVVDYPGYGPRERFSAKKTATVYGTIKYNGVPVPFGNVNLTMVNEHWTLIPDDMSANIPYRYSFASGQADSNGNFAINITVNNGVGTVNVQHPNSGHFFDYLTYIRATTDSGAFDLKLIYIIAFSYYGTW